MKIKVVLLFLFCTVVAKAQMWDLLKMSQGKLVLSSVLYDSNEKLYGYFYLYEMDAAEKNKLNMEYVLLDKNLNKVNNGEFVAPKFNSLLNKSYYDDCTLMDDKLVLTRNYAYSNVIESADVTSPHFLLSSFFIISLKDKTVSDEMTYKDGKIVKVPADISQMKSENKKIPVKNVVSAYCNEKQSGFYVTKSSEDKDYLEKDVTFFDKECNLKWSYEYNPSGSSREYTTFRFMHLNGNNLYISETKWLYSNFSSYRIVKLDFETGKKLYEYNMEPAMCQYIHRVNAKEIDGRLYLTGDYINRPKNNLLDFSSKKVLGLYRIVLDDKGNEVENKHLTWDKFTPFVGLGKKNKDKDGFYLRPCRYFMFADGRMSVVTEKFMPYKPGVNILIPIIGNIVYYSTHKYSRTSDFILLDFDKQFNPIKADTIHKELCKLSELNRNQPTDYLFSRYIRNDSAAVFFYQNYYKDKVEKKDAITLGINVIESGKVTEEKIPLLAKKKFYIEVLPAKEGYIMLREYNKDEKHNEIRLEKLNY